MQFLFSTLGTVEVVGLLVGVSIHSSEFREKLDHFPKVQGEKKHYLKPPPVDGRNPAPPGMVKTL